MIVQIEYVDYSPEYGLFGKVIARSDVRDLDVFDIEEERLDFLSILTEGGEYPNIGTRLVEEIRPC